MFKVEEINTIINEEPIKRNERILNEVQPILRGLMQRFIDQNKDRFTFLENYYIHGYEGTLKTTINDLKNPDYSEKKQSYGTRGFVELVKKDLLDQECNLLKLECNLQEEKVTIKLDSKIYPFLKLYKRNEKIEGLLEIIDLLSLDIDLMIGGEIVQKSEFVSRVEQLIKEKKKPTLSFGKSYSLSYIENEDFILKELTIVLNSLKPIYEYLFIEQNIHEEVMKIGNQVSLLTEPITINLFNNQYTIEFEEREKFKQVFSLYEHKQLITKGTIEFSKRLSYSQYDYKESLLVNVNGNNLIAFMLRKLVEDSNGKWRQNISFYQRTGLSNEDLKRKAESVLKEHQFAIEGSQIIVGTFNKITGRFEEEIKDIKATLVKAALIFADVKGSFTLPKLEEEQLIEEDDVDEVQLENLSPVFELSNILQKAEESPLTFSQSIIRDFHLNLTCLEDKHFVILNGISGTGKTQLCRLYGNAVYGLNYEDENPYYELIAVRPDWMDSSPLFGYYSNLEKRYISTPFLNMILKANQEKHKPHFIVLDEMNLAKVEYYLSDYLSAVESRLPIHLHNEENETDIPKSIKIPHNVYIIGTINVDETTHSISDKVLDRAFVMTLSDIHLSNYWESKDTKFKSVLQQEWTYLTELYQFLIPYELHFGYRSINEMLNKLYANARLEDEFKMDVLEAFDVVISEKILPKIKGDERISTLIEILIKWTENTLLNNSITNKHLLRMRRELELYGATQFWR
ncbi:hypothetical protein RAH41_21425 [Gottfriedia acidiceleris]|uniref:McrB family protein n=1 Tax=Gottfriedia acidiceleris TaxID=371036 RepID=UPI002F26174F